ncbi:hypothetical protein NQ318_018680 [Aromia moschata]|uniref:Peptidase A1 domain-containing protein n=1 Tax=Aromia moschata TaxID=1265417 RepID=A0AAV8ZIP7_9CUCU|nr:hypothetical protein NQ318_018680 [Aromia moschata]
MNFLLICVISITTSTALGALPVNNGTIRVELVRHKSAFEQHINAPNLEKYGLNFDELFKPHNTNRTNDSIALYRYFDNEFYGQIVIGHPGQTLNVAFDTAWSLSWVISEKCEIWKTIGCWFHHRYDHTKSSEYKKDNRPYSGNEGTYNLTGFYSYDNISIAHSNVTAQSFVEMVNVPYTYIFSKIDGVLGLGLKTGDYDPFFYKLLRQKKIKNPIFSIFLNRDRQSNKGGNIMLGFVDDKHIHKTQLKNGTIIDDTITYLPVDPGQYWQFSMDSIVVSYSSKENFTLCPTGCKAISDTSSNDIIGPVDDVAKIHDAIKAKHFFLGKYTVNCETVNKLPKIDFVLGGQYFQLEGPQYIVKMSYRSFSICLSAFVPSTYSYQKGWVLGGAFLAEYYSIYDIYNKNIGFVKAA